ncbi:MAG: hypothetical protein KBA08_03925 [Firmicutes bacterium]|nr:hypothetical protein [Bacillota bacterium]
MSKIAIVIAGILAAIIVLVFVASAVANSLFEKQVSKEVEKLFGSGQVDKKEIITEADLAGLPSCVQKWLAQSQVVGKEKISTVRLKQSGVMRLKEDQPWMPFEAEQYFNVDEPGFVWKAKVKMNPLLYFSGRDRYFQGRGEMDIKALSLLTVANAGASSEMDQSAMLRYLAEMIWFPTAALSNYIKWEEIDANSARATMNYRGMTGSGVYTFDDKGAAVSFFAKRYRETNGQFTLDPWGGVVKGYNEFNSVRIPARLDVIWQLETGDFNWFQCEITEIDYNKPQL